jgi:hypothetical protein
VAQVATRMLGSTISGATFSAVSGGIGTLAVVAAVAWLFPQLRRYGRLDSGRPRDSRAEAEAVTAEAAQSEAPRTAS